MPKLKNMTGEISPSALQHALDSVEIAGAWDWDIASDLVWADTFVALLFNVDPSDAAAGLPLSGFIEGIHPDDQEHVHTLIRRCIDEDTPFVAEYRVCSADGVTRWVLDRGYIIRDQEGRPVRGRGVIVDITWSRTSKLTFTAAESEPDTSPLEQAAAHAIAAQQAITRLHDPELKARADALLMGVGRRLAQQEVRERRKHIN